jgi:hypothetical protein
MKREDIPTPICDASADSIVGEPGLISYETGQELERDRAELLAVLQNVLADVRYFSEADALLERIK